MIFKIAKKVFTIICAMCVFVCMAISVKAVDPDPKASASVCDMVKTCNQKICDIEKLYSQWSDKKLLNSQSRVRASTKLHIAYFKSVLEDLKKSIKIAHNVSVENDNQSQCLDNFLNSIYDVLQKIIVDDFNNKKTNKYISDLSVTIDSFEKFLNHLPVSSFRKIEKSFGELFGPDLNPETVLK